MGDPFLSSNGNLVCVLHVDDDPDILAVSHEILMTMGNFEIEHAFCVDEALQKLKTSNFDVVVSDYEMPHKDGLDFLKLLKEQNNTIPFILFTGKGREEIAIQALNSGAAYYLNKHGDPETVYAELAHAIVNVAKVGKAEKSLRDSEAKYRELINGMSESVWVIDFDGNFFDVNNAAVKSLGYSKDELLSLGIQGIDKQLTKEQVKDLIDQLQRVGTQLFETNHTAKNGTKIPVEISSSLVTYQGKPAILSIARDITERKKNEQLLRENEDRLKLKLDSVFSPDTDISSDELSNILDVPQIQAMMDDLYAVTNTVFALLDLNGNVLIKTGWQDICTKFHRKNPITEKNCQESDLSLSKDVKQGEFRLYKCKNNMWDIVTPLIINDKHVGNIYTGQFFFEDEVVDRDLFVLQAKTCGFNTEEYLSALDKVPRLSREKVNKLMQFNVEFSEMISKLSYSNLKATKALVEQKIIERSLRESERRFATTLSSIGDAVIATDTSGKITFMNYEAERLTGWSLTEAKSKTVQQVFKIINEQTRIEVTNPIEKVLETGKIVGLANHTILIRKDGSEIAIDDCAAPIKTEDGQLSGVVLVFKDITERKTAENLLVESERRYHSLFSSMNEGVCLHELVYNESGEAVDYRILDANSAYETLTAIARKDAVGMLASTLYGAKKPPYLNIYAKVAEGGEPVSFGTYFPPMKKFFLISVFSPAKGKFATVFADFTEQKKTEEELKESKHFIQKILDSAPNIIYIYDLMEHRSVYGNTEMLHFLGFTKEQIEVMGSGLLAHVIHPDDMKAVSEHHALFADAPDNVVYEVEYRVKDAQGRWRWMHSRDTLFSRTLEGKGKQILGTTEDVTERRQAKNDLIVANKKIHVVCGLTRHDIANKLMIAESNLYLLKKRLGKNPDFSTYLNGVSSAIVESIRILELSRFYEKIGSQMLSTIDVGESFDEAVKMFPNIDPIKVTNKCRGLKIVADSLLTQLFYNFIDNSIKHGKTVSEIKLHCIEDNRGLKLFYEDDGVGVSEANKLKLFNEGFTTGKGSGLGLKLIKAMVEVYGWNITEEGKRGAKFVLTIPYA